jgi:hypothetical protein
MDNDLTIALVGIAGTISGTILGWFLNSLWIYRNILIKVKHYSFEIGKTNNWGNFEKPQDNETKEILLIIKMTIYNKSDIYIKQSVKQKFLFTIIVI